MALRFGKTWSARTAPLATIGLVLTAVALFTTQAEARHWRHYYRAYARHQAAPAAAPSAKPRRRVEITSPTASTAARRG